MSFNCRKQPSASLLSSLPFAVLFHTPPCCPMMSSLQRHFGLPTDLTPSDCLSVLLVVHQLSFIQAMCPAHFHLVLVTYWTMSVTLVLCLMVVLRILPWHNQGKQDSIPTPKADTLTPDHYGFEENFGGSQPEWCISSMIYSRDTPIWSETLEFYTLVFMTVYQSTYTRFQLVRSSTQGNLQPTSCMFIKVIVLAFNK